MIVRPSRQREPAITRMDSSLRNRKEVSVLPTEQKKAFGAFYGSARNNQILDPKTTLLVHLATSMAVACDP
jgi:hypothetical protein